MPHYIDADFLINELKKKHGSNWHGMTWNSRMIASLLRNAQKVDAVEVVRCEDCMFWKTVECYMDNELILGTPAEGYCSCGWRKK